MILTVFFLYGINGAGKGLMIKETQVKHRYINYVIQRKGPIITLQTTKICLQLITFREEKAFKTLLSIYSYTWIFTYMFKVN